MEFGGLWNDPSIWGYIWLKGGQNKEVFGHFYPYFFSSPPKTLGDCTWLGLASYPFQIGAIRLKDIFKSSIASIFDLILIKMLSLFSCY